MLDIKFIRENKTEIKKTIKNKRVDLDLERLLKLDDERLKILREIEKLQAEKNKINDSIRAAKSKAEREKIIAEGKEIKNKIEAAEPNYNKILSEYSNLMILVPNIPFSDVPIGKDESENKVIKKWGEIPKFDFKPKDHVELGENLDIIDIERATKVTGARFNYLKGDAAMLEVALLQFVFKTLANQKIVNKIADSVEKGFSDKIFIPVFPPVMIKPEVFTKMARLNEQDKDERYYLPQDNLYLIGSAEHTLGSMHMDEVLEEKNLPIRYIGFSTSFRREAGSYGKDTRGILRVHQFDKIEMESFTTAENSLKEHNFFVAIQEYLVQTLKIPYQVVLICTGDMGKPDAHQIDIECWMPAQGKYRETHTADLMTDFQARRLNTRVKRNNGKLELAHTNDATAFAIGRILIAILENFQQADGSVRVPKVLQEYVGKEIIKAKG